MTYQNSHSKLEKAGKVVLFVVFLRQWNRGLLQILQHLVNMPGSVCDTQLPLHSNAQGLTCSEQDYLP